jgi:type II secretory pathway component GspD/PulD (secretin)
MSLAAKQIPRQLRQPLRLFLILLLVLPTPGFSQAREKTTSSGERVIVCMIQIEHADAEYLASVLEPFLSPEGSIVPYKPTNTLIIKDRAPVVNMLAEAIKGKPCTPISHPSDVENGLQQQEFYLDLLTEF